MFHHKDNVWWKHAFLPMATIVVLHHRHTKVVICQAICTICYACSLRKGFNQSICRTKEQKTRIKCLASAMPKFAMVSGATMRKVCKEAKRKNLAVLAKTSRLKRLFFSKAFKQQH